MTAMRCEEMQELILSDYADGELSEESRLEVEEHTRVCQVCRDLAQVMREHAIKPFAEASRIEPPAYILERVKEKIASETARRGGVLEGARALAGEILLSLTKIPRPVVVFAATVMVIVAIMIALPFSETDGVHEYLGEQASFIANLDAEEVNGISIFDTDIRMGAEKFL